MGEMARRPVRPEVAIPLNKRKVTKQAIQILFKKPTKQTNKEQTSNEKTKLKVNHNLKLNLPCTVSGNVSHN